MIAGFFVILICLFLCFCSYTLKSSGGQSLGESRIVKVVAIKSNLNNIDKCYSSWKPFESQLSPLTPWQRIVSKEDFYSTRITMTAIVNGVERFRLKWILERVDSWGIWRGL